VTSQGDTLKNGLTTEDKKGNAGRKLWKKGRGMILPSWMNKQRNNDTGMKMSELYNT
jgi:hypothetical protein